MSNIKYGTYKFRQVGGGMFEGMQHEAEFKIENGIMFARDKNNHFSKWQVINNIPEGATDVKFNN